MTPSELDAELDRLAEEVRPQARAEAWRAFQRAPHALELDELHAIALTGLAQARARWRTYCAQYGRDPERIEYFVAYILRRMRGAILDAMRSQDWVTRSARTKVKLLREHGSETGATEAELARATGLSAREIRDASAALAARPVSFDAEPHDVTDATADVEGTAVVSGVLQAATAVVAALPETARYLMVFRYYEGMSLVAAAQLLGVEPDEARRQWESAVLAVYDSMLKAVT
jgi:RNA polymerase sigma factor for flagellar operon FliA